MVAELRAMPDVRLLPRSTVFGYHDHNFLTINERRTDHLPPAKRSGARERVWRVRAEAGGARHRRASSGRWCSPTTTGRA